MKEFLVVVGNSEYGSFKGILCAFMHVSKTETKIVI